MTTSEYKLFIPSAGLGTRLGDETKNLNKALVAIDNKPGISHIIDKFPKDMEVVIAIGHLGNVLEQYLEHAYPDRKITTVKIENYDGPGSGLGRTLLDCEEHLQCPFVFCSNDTIVTDDIPPPDYNWIGYDANCTVGQSKEQFRTISISSKHQAVELFEKGVSSQHWPYIGLAGVSDYEEFWSFMHSGINKGSIETGESYALGLLLKKGVKAIGFDWYDTGNKKTLEETRAALKTDSGINVLPKSNEAIWFVNGKVIKYSVDTDFIKKRVDRAQDLHGFSPKIAHVTTNMYSYEMIRGKTVSSAYSNTVFENLLNTLSAFWKKPDKPVTDFSSNCLRFYKDKTKKRVQQYFDRFEYKDQEETINGSRLPTLSSLLSKVDWESLAQGVQVRFHGDLHFENILISEDYNFLLLDWRQDFDGIREVGDIYYDFAKLLHGLIVSHEMVNKDQFEIEADGDVVEFDILRSYKLVQAEHMLRDYVEKTGYSWSRVRLLTSLIYLNIAALHHYPYSKFLFYLGKSMLAEVLNENE